MNSQVARQGFTMREALTTSFADISSTILKVSFQGLVCQILTITNLTTDCCLGLQLALLDSVVFKSPPGGEKLATSLAQVSCFFGVTAE